MNTVQPRTARIEMSWGRVATLIAVSVLLTTLAGAFSGLKTNYLIKNILGLSASQMATLGLITGIPAYLRPFLGAGADLFPLGGFHRRTYYAVSWALSAAGYFALASLHHYDRSNVVLLALVGGLGGNLLMVITDAVMVAVGNRTGTVGRMQSIQQGLPLVAGLTFVGPLSGYVTHYWSYHACFLASGLVCVLAIPLFAMIAEERVVHARHSHESEEEHATRMVEIQQERAEVSAAMKAAARSPGLWAMVAFVFYLIVTPGTNTAQFYYMVNVLHFSQNFIAHLVAPGSAGAAVGILIFFFASRRLPVRAMVWGAYLMDCSLYLATMLLRNHQTAILMTILTALLGTVYNLCLLTIAARACPPRAEATVYGLMISATSLAGALGEQLGAAMYDYLGPGSHHSVVHGWFGLLWFGLGFTVIAAVFIPFLPAWARSNEPLRPRAESLAEAS